MPPRVFLVAQPEHSPGSVALSPEDSPRSARLPDALALPAALAATFRSFRRSGSWPDFRFRSVDSAQISSAIDYDIAHARCTRPLLPSIV